MNESRQTYKSLMSHIWMRHFPRMNKSCHEWQQLMCKRQTAALPMTQLPDVHVHARVTSHIWMSQAPQTWMNYVPHMNESCPTYECVMSHVWMSHVPRMNSWHGLVPGIHVRACVTSTHERIRSQIHINRCMSHMNESCPTYDWVLSHTWMSHVPHMNQVPHTYKSMHITCVSVYISKCIWTYTQTCMNIFSNIYAYTSKYPWIHIQISMNMYLVWAYRHVYICETSIYEHKYRNIHMWECACLSAGARPLSIYIYVYHANIYERIHMYIYIFMYAYVCMPECGSKTSLYTYIHM